jgi:hypothetical protein
LILKKHILILLLFLIVYPAMSSARQIDAPVSPDTKPDDNAELSFGRSDLVTPIMLRDEIPASSSLLRAVRNKAGFAFAGSAILPGASQAAHGNWLRAGIYFAIEAAALYGHLEYKNRAIRGERNYERFADQNWSVVQYADWIVEYHEYHSISNPYLDELAASINGREPAFDTSVDWQAVDIELLRQVERNTPYITTDDLAAQNFSHVLPAYGSQQYYELVSKYYQYAPGWRDYYTHHTAMETNPFLIDRLGAGASPFFWDGSRMSEKFNDQFRFSNNMLSLLILNHFISAFDAYFTVRLQNRGWEATASGTPGSQFRLTYRF